MNGAQWLMQWLCGLTLVTTGIPLAAVWRANRGSALAATVAWALAAWVSWGAALLAPVVGIGDSLAVPYLALGLTGCAAVALLGARRPGVGAWNFVVVGFLTVILLPLAEGFLRGGRLHLAWFQVILLAGVLGVGILNYLPTRLGWAALMLGLGCAGQLAGVAHWEPLPEALATVTRAAGWLIALAPWVAAWSIKTVALPTAEFDRRWLYFRDRFGLVWGQRLREQFNRSAAHAGWPVTLYWQGLRLTSREDKPGLAEQEEIVATLRALMKRFEPENPERHRLDE
jgi:hypothetical protein